MKKDLISMVKGIFRKFGYEITIKNKKKFNLSLYNILYPKQSLIEKRFYNIGAGNFYHPYWTNIDKKNDWFAKDQTHEFINFDLLSLRPLPIESNSAEVIYTRHVIEHITDEASLNLFKEAYRVLKNNGFIRILAPDINLYLKAYKSKDKFFFYDIYKGDWYRLNNTIKARVCYSKPLCNASISQLFLLSFAAHVSKFHVNEKTEKFDDDEIDNIFKEYPVEKALDFFCKKCSLEVQEKFPGNHINWWNEEKTIKMLRKAGFKKIYKSRYLQSALPILRDPIFDRKPGFSFYIEAIK
ncbi:MAG: class I SAM-dependent methyltransferase [Candidatus Helarchaeota archaeon]